MKSNLTQHHAATRLEQGLLPCQIWARRCLWSRELGLAEEFRRQYREQLAGKASIESTQRARAALTSIQAARGRWPQDCLTCRAPAQLGVTGNLPRCQALRDYFDLD